MVTEIATRNNTSSPPYDSSYSDEENHAMQRATLRLFSKWGINDSTSCKLLGGISTKTLQRWRKGEYGDLSIDQADRISNLLAIHKALRIIFKDARRYYGWVSKPNDAFDGKSALDVMLNGHLRDISRVRRYLDAVRGSW